VTGRFVLFLSRRMLRGRDGAARYLRGAVIGIAVSFIPLVVVMEVSTGMIEGITARLLEVGTYHLQAALPPDIRADQLEAAAQAVGRVSGVLAAVPERIGTAMIVSARGAAGVSVRFVPPDVFQRDRGFRSFVTIRAGDATLARADSLLLSSALAGSLGVSAGDRVNLLTTWGENLSGPPRLTPVTVSGIYDTGYQELDSALAYAPLALAAKVLSPRAARVMIGVKVRDPFGDLTTLEHRVALAAGDTRVAGWRDIEYARLSSFQTTKALLLLIMALIVVVACVNVSSSVLMLLFERRSDLGILKSVGAGPRSLSAAFLLAGLAMGAVGAALGVAVGLAVAVNINEVIHGLEWVINRALDLASLLAAPFSGTQHAFGGITLFNSAYYLRSIPIRIQPGEVAAAAVIAIVLAALAAYLPARRAARTRPLEILRKV
jgi:lipoprotein-releasing system permease protein